MMHGMSVLGWLETRELFPVIWARNLGKKQVNQQPLLKDLFMMQASGLIHLKDTRYCKTGE